MPSGLRRIAPEPTRRQSDIHTKETTDMAARHFWTRFGLGVGLLAAGAYGCDSKLPVAETPPPVVSVSQPVVHEVVDQDDYEGRIAAPDTVEVRARVRGHLVKVAFKDGQAIKKG